MRFNKKQAEIDSKFKMAISRLMMVRFRYFKNWHSLWVETFQIVVDKITKNPPTCH